MSTNDQRNQKTFSGSEWRSYDGLFSAMSTTLMDGATLLSFAPIFKDMIGKEAKKGERVYDYDNRINMAIQNNAFAIKEAINAIRNDADLKSVSVGGETDVSSTLTIFAPGAVKLNGKSFPDNFVVRATVVRDDEKVRVYHVMQNSLLQTTSVNDEEMEYVIESDLDMLAAACDASITNAFNLPRHAAAQVRGSSGSGSSRRSSGFTNVAEDDETVDTESETRQSPEERRRSASRLASRPSRGSTARSLSAEDDNEGETGEQPSAPQGQSSLNSARNRRLQRNAGKLPTEQSAPAKDSSPAEEYDNDVPA